MSRPWMPLYIADYLRDTRKLTTAEHGAYLLLIMEYWTAGELPADDRQLARIVGMTAVEWRKAKPNVQEFFTNGWRHKRIDEEMLKAEAKHTKRSEAGRRGGLASANAKQTSSNAQASSSQPQSERKEEDTPDGVPSRYEFESGVIKLVKKDFDLWKQSFSHLDIAAELLSLTEWAGQQPKWFFAVSAALAKRNREVKIAKEKQVEQPFKWNGMEGVL